MWNNELWSASTSEYSTSEIDWFSCFNSTDNERAGGREQVGEDGDWASEQKEKKKSTSNHNGQYTGDTADVMPNDDWNTQDCT